MYTLGIDIGSTTSKCAVLKDGTELAGKSLQRGGLGTDGPAEALAELWRSCGLTQADMARTVVTGYGRKNYEGADSEISELTAHALGGRFVFPDLRTVIDIGGQDAKVIALTPSGKMSNFVMNDKCAAGTGRFLDVMASILRMDVDELGDCAAQATAPAAISSTCTVFAESEVISQLAMGTNKCDIIHGIHKSVAGRVSGLCHRIGVRDDVVMTGGVAQNHGIVKALQEQLGHEIHTTPLTQYNGALGAALFAYQKALKNK